MASIKTPKRSAKRSKRRLAPVYNEPLPSRDPDRFPRMKAVSTKALGTVVATRLALERDLRSCASGSKTRSLPRGADVVLLAMLEEGDSPLSASLRAQAASLAGSIGLTKAGAALRSIALDEAEDLATRLGATRSLLRLAGRKAPATFRALLRSREWRVRACAFSEAAIIGSTLKELAERHLRAERSAKVKAYVALRARTISAATATSVDRTR